VRQPGRVRKKQAHVVVLAGGRQVDDMVVFLMYRKLKALLEQERSPGQPQPPDGRNQG